MSAKPLSLDGFMESLASFSGYNNRLNDGEDIIHRKMLKSLKNIVDGELTERQKKCIWLYYGKTMKMKEIAEEMGIGISSVSRHIKKSKEKIKKTMEYYF